MRKKYTDFQLTAIIRLIRKYKHLYYNMGAKLEEEYYQLTGDIRASGALYMVAWRMEKGHYLHRGFAA